MRLVVGITGASGIQYGLAMLRILAETDVETHAIVTQAGRRVMSIETDADREDVEELATEVHNPNDVAATIASGSFAFDGMIVCPCSMKTLGLIANGIADGLVPRVADVCLKEDRDLLLVPREAPMAQAHLENMARAGELGAVVAPAAPGFYTDPDSLEDLVCTFAARLLERVGVETDHATAWEGQPPAGGP